MSERSTERSGGALTALSRHSLTGRVFLTVLTGLSACVVVVALSFIGAAAAERPGVARSDARDSTSLLAEDLRRTRSRLDASLAAPSSSLALAAALSTGAEVSGDHIAQFARLKSITDASAVVVVGFDGAVRYADASVSDEHLLSEFAADTGPVPVQGEIALEDGLSVVAVRPVVRSGAGAPLGWLAIATPLRVSDLAVTGRASIDSSARMPAANLLRIEDPFFDEVLLSVDSDAYYLSMKVPGVDGKLAGSISVRNRYPSGLLDSSLGALLAAAIGAVVLAGGIVGILLSRQVSRTAGELREYVEARISGDDSEPAHALSRSLPLEFQAVAGAFDDVLGRLGRRDDELHALANDLGELEMSLNIILNDSLEGKILVREGRIELINPAASSHLGIGRDDASGVHFEQAVSSVDFSDESGHHLDGHELLRRCAGSTSVVAVSRPGRSTRYLEVHCTVHRTRQAVQLLTTRDISEARRSEELRSEIMSVVSHDLRAPLTVITGYLDLLTKPLDAGSRETAVTAARRAATRMQDLLADLLSVTRAEEVFAPERMDPIDLGPLALDVCRSLEPSAAQRLACTVEGEGVVLGEEKRLRQVVYNLVTNAIKYAPPDSTIDVTVRPLDHTVALIVEDEGPGIPDEDRDVIFQRFTRLPDGGSRRPGVGLGLYIVSAIVESHGGSVRVERGGKTGGAQFVVELPAASA